LLLNPAQLFILHFKFDLVHLKFVDMPLFFAFRQLRLSSRRLGK
jgi:hypothetical protein